MVTCDYAGLELRTLAEIRRTGMFFPDFHTMALPPFPYFPYYYEVALGTSGLMAIVSAVGGEVLVRFCRTSSPGFSIERTVCHLSGGDFVALMGESEEPVSGACFRAFGKSFIKRGSGTSPVPVRFRLQEAGFVEYLAPRDAVTAFLKEVRRHVLLAEVNGILES